jgi:hypothetical protein
MKTPTDILADWGWSKSRKPNTYVPKPVSVWVRSSDNAHALVHRGRVDMANDECLLHAAEMRAFADLADAPAVHEEPVTTTTSVRMLVWKRDGSKRRVRCLDVFAGELTDVIVGWGDDRPTLMLMDSGELGTEDDPRPFGRGLWVWVGTATSVSRSGDPDEISLRGEWRRPNLDEVVTVVLGRDS